MAATDLPPGKAARMAAQKSPEALYLQGYLALRDGKEKEKAGDLAGAYSKYEGARDLFDATGRLDPAWQKELVDFRRRKTGEDMERVRLLELQRRPEGREVPKAPQK